jgi:hypothetical protein
MMAFLLLAQLWAAEPSLTLRGTASSEHDRPYSTTVRPRQIAGLLALSCEYGQGAPCGEGTSGAVDVDGEAGFGKAVTARMRLRAASPGGVFLDRAVLQLAFGSFAFQVGRDAFTLGPAARSSLTVSANAAPQDGLRAQLLPVSIAPGVRLSLLYFIDRLREPQRFHGTLLDCARLELEFAERVQLGGSRLLELGGEGAPDYGGFSGFLLEHFGRTREGIGIGSAENNRLSFDLNVRLPDLWAGRVYYQIAFEDTRKQFFNSLHYDADHLLGIELRDLGAGALKRFNFEALRTGWVSQEHGIFTAGMTNAGRTLGPALGPDGASVWARVDLEVKPVTVSPWIEWLRFLSDRYSSDERTGVFVTAKGEIEHRQRLGADVETRLERRVLLTMGIFAERIGNADFVPGVTKFGLGARASLTVTVY